MPDLIHPWWFIVLSLSSWRVFRLLAEDTILDKPRNKLLRLGDWNEQSGEDPPDEYKEEWAIFITCPYCAGFWISGIALALYSIIIEWHGVLAFLATWFATSATVALLAKTDELLVQRNELLEKQLGK